MTDISPELRDFVEMDALCPGDPELCGVVAADGAVYQLPNIHENPANGFRVDPKSFLEQVENGAVATWHTHPGRDPTLSEEDLEGFRAWPHLVHIIIGVRNQELAFEAYKVVDGGIVVKA
jgi:proteasome lid subunit RPN8/RPN11